MVDRLKNPGTWIGFTCALCGTLSMAAVVPEVWHPYLDLVTAVAGLAGSWFFSAGMAPPPPPKDLSASAAKLGGG